jgi:hypothetical protein
MKRFIVFSRLELFTIPMSRAVRVFLLATLFVCSSALAQTASPKVRLFPGLRDDPLYDQETYQKIRDITIDVSWNQVELSATMRDLTLAVRNTHPIRGAINFRISSEAPPAFRQQKVSLTMRGVPVYQALEILSRQVPFTIKVHPDVVLIMPGPAR